MKNLCLLSLTLLWIAPVYGQMIDPLDEAKTRERILQNKIYKITQWSYKYDGDKPAAKGNISVVTTYDKEGNQVEVVNYNSGKISTIQKYAYDIKGNKSEYTNFDANKKVNTYSQTFLYNDKGNVVRENGFDGLSPYHVDHEYDSLNRPIDICKYDSNKLVEEQWLYTYQDSTTLITILKKNKLTNKQRIVYNPKGQKIEEVRLDPNDKEIRKTTYAYTPNGRVEKRLEYISGNLRYTHNYVYDDENKLVEVIQIDPNGKHFSYSTYKYDQKGNLLQEQWSENKGIEYSKKDSTYDPQSILRKVDSYYAPYEYQIMYQYTYEFYN